MNQYRYVASSYFPEVNGQKSANAQQPADIRPQEQLESPVPQSPMIYQQQPQQAYYSPQRFAPMQVHDVKPRVHFAEPEPSSKQESYSAPVYSSYAGAEHIPPVYNMAYTLQRTPQRQEPALSTAVEFTPAQNFSAPPPSPAYNYPVHLQRQDTEVPSLPVELVTASITTPRTYKAYAPQEEASMFVFERDDDKAQKFNPVTEPFAVGQTFVPSVPSNNYNLQNEESTYIGFKSDVAAAYGARRVPASYEMANVTQTPTVKMVEPQSTPASECNTAMEPIVPEQPQSRFVRTIATQHVDEQPREMVEEQSVRSPGPVGEAFLPADAGAQSHYHFDNLNDEVSCIQ